MSTGVVLLAAGSGQRLGGSTPKQFQPLHGEPLFLRSLRTFLKVRSISEVVVVASPLFLKKTQTILKRVKSRKKIHVVSGGLFRGESVRNGIAGFVKLPDIVLIHDSARPFVEVSMIKRVEKGVRDTGVALAAWPLPDTLKKTRGHNFVSKTLARKNLWLAQTPQGFKKKIALDCLMKPHPHATDDVELAERKGYRVKLIPGAAFNFKITTRDDWALAKKMEKR